MDGDVRDILPLRQDKYANIHVLVAMLYHRLSPRGSPPLFGDQLDARHPLYLCQRHSYTRQQCPRTL